MTNSHSNIFSFNKNILKKSRIELDLLDQKKVKSYFKIEKPKYVICSAAKVGGILANNTLKIKVLFADKRKF